MRNYAGHRLAPWLAHVMVSRQETARALLTPGEVMQLPATDELILVSGLSPIRAKKLRYYEDPTFKARALPAPTLSDGPYHDRPTLRPDDWSGLVRERDPRLEQGADAAPEDEGGLQQQRAPDLAEVSSVPVVESDKPDLGVDDDGDLAADTRAMAAAQTASTIVRAHAINEGSDREESLPSF